MSETARRIKLLLSIKNNSNFAEQKKDEYSVNDMVKNRLYRLVSMKQVFLDNKNRYKSKNNLLFYVSCLINYWKKILGLNND